MYGTITLAVAYIYIKRPADRTDRSGLQSIPYERANLYFSFGGAQAVARVSKYEISQIGDTIHFVFMPSKMHFFDKETGVNYTEM